MVIIISLSIGLCYYMHGDDSDELFAFYSKITRPEYNFYELESQLTKLNNYHGISGEKWTLKNEKLLNLLNKLKVTI